jgi:hypothetical protein
MTRVVRGERSTVRPAVVLGVAVVVAGAVLMRRIRCGARCGRATLGDEDGFLWPDEYQRLTGISKESYEWHLLVEAQSSMMGEWTVEPGDAPGYTRLGVLERGSVDDVRLERDGTEAALVVLFRSDDRPDCVFGWRMPIWPTPPPDGSDDDDGTPEGWAYIVSLNLRALVEVAPRGSGLRSRRPGNHLDRQLRSGIRSLRSA